MRYFSITRYKILGDNFITRQSFISNPFLDRGLLSIIFFEKVFIDHSFRLSLCYIVRKRIKSSLSKVCLFILSLISCYIHSFDVVVRYESSQVK